MSKPLPKVSEQVVANRFEGNEVVIVDLGAKRYYTLNETAALVWTALEAEDTEDAIVARMAADYEVTPEQARASITRLIGDFRDLQLLAPEA